MEQQFRMMVKDVFRFSDGTTVFAGNVLEGPKFIHAGQFELKIDGKLLGLVHLDGERMSGTGQPGIRSIGITQPLEFDLGQIKEHEASFVLREAA